jgi:hypothetical protein
MKVLRVIEAVLAIAALVGILAALVLWLFPGIWRGLGVGEAIKAANAVATSAGTVPSPIASPADLMALLLTVVTIILAVVSVLLGALAILIAVLGFFGFGYLRDFATTVATSQITPLEEQVKQAIANMDTQFADFRTTWEEEHAEAGGLAQGEASDAMAAAASGKPADIPS